MTEISAPLCWQPMLVIITVIVFHSTPKKLWNLKLLFLWCWDSASCFPSCLQLSVQNSQVVLNVQLYYQLFNHVNNNFIFVLCAQKLALSCPSVGLLVLKENVKNLQCHYNTYQHLQSLTHFCLLSHKINISCLLHVCTETLM